MKILKMILKPLLRLLLILGAVIVIPMLIFYMFTGRNWFELIDDIKYW